MFFLPDKVKCQPVKNRGLGDARPLNCTQMAALLLGLY